MNYIAACFSDVNKIKDAIGDKLGNTIQHLSSFFFGIVISFIRGWKLSLVISSLAPLLLIIGKVYGTALGHMASKEMKAYSKAGMIAEEVFTAIRTVFTFNGARKEHKRFFSQQFLAKL